MEKRKAGVRLGWSDLTNPANPNHHVAWEQAIRACIDYNIQPPTFFELIAQNNFGSVDQNDLIEKIGHHASGFYWDDLVMVNGRHILNINAGYFIYLGADEVT